MFTVKSQYLISITGFFAIAATICELIVIRSGTSAYWGNVTAILAIATVVMGSVTWYVYDARRYNYSFKRKTATRKFTCLALLLLLVGFAIQSRAETSTTLATSQVFRTFDNWYGHISAGVLIAALTILASSVLIKRTRSV